MMKLHLSLAVLGTAATLMLPVASIAQPANETQPSRSNDQARVEQRIGQLHDQLQITPAQQTQWNQFAQVMQQNADDMRQAIYQRGDALNSMTAVQNMQSYTHLADVHAQDMERLTSAFQTLYASMSPQQQQNADQVFRYKAARHAANVAHK